MSRSPRLQLLLLLFPLHLWVLPLLRRWQLHQPLGQWVTSCHWRPSRGQSRGPQLQPRRRKLCRLRCRAAPPGQPQAAPNSSTCSSLAVPPLRCLRWRQARARPPSPRPLTPSRRGEPHPRKSAPPPAAPLRRLPPPGPGAPTRRLSWQASWALWLTPAVVSTSRSTRSSWASPTSPCRWALGAACRGAASGPGLRRREGCPCPRTLGTWKLTARLSCTRCSGHVVMSAAAVNCSPTPAAVATTTAAAASASTAAGQAGCAG